MSKIDGCELRRQNFDLPFDFQYGACNTFERKCNPSETSCDTNGSQEVALMCFSKEIGQKKLVNNL